MHFEMYVENVKKYRCVCWMCCIALGAVAADPSHQMLLMDVYYERNTVVWPIQWFGQRPLLLDSGTHGEGVFYFVSSFEVFGVYPY